MRFQGILTAQTSTSESLNAPKPRDANQEPVGFRALLRTRGVLVASLNYSFLSLVDISTRAILPLFFSTPIHLGGLGLDPAMIGAIMSVCGILNGFMQVIFF